MPLFKTKKKDYFFNKLNDFRNYIYSDLLSFDKKKKSVFTLIRFIYTTIRVFYLNHCLRQGAALAYATLLSIFPLVAVLFFLVPIVISDEGDQLKVQQTILSFLIPGSVEAQTDYISTKKKINPQTSDFDNKKSSELSSEQKDTSSTILSYAENKSIKDDFGTELKSYFKRYRVEVTKLKAIGIIGTIFVAIILFITVEQSFAIIWGVRKRPFLKSFTLFTGIIFWIPFLIGLSLYFSAEISSRVGIVGRKMDIFLPLILTFAAFFLAYAFIPNTKVNLKWAMIGAAISSVFWEVAKTIFNRIVFSSTNYQNLFNALGALPYLLIWLYISWLIILLGVVITYCGQNLKALLYEDISKAFKLTNPSLIVIILFILADRLERGLKGASIDTIKEHCPITNDELLLHLEILTNSDIIRLLTDEQIFILVKPPHKIFLKELFSMKNHIDKIFHYEEAGKIKLLEQFSEIDLSLSDILKEKSLKEILPV